MNKSAVIKFFGSEYAAAKAIGISKQAVNRWGDIIPPLRAFQLRDKFPTLDAPKSRRGKVSK